MKHTNKSRRAVRGPLMSALGIKLVNAKPVYLKATKDGIEERG